MNIGSIIRKLRKERNITQEKFAEYLNISSQAVSRWENGSACPDIATIPAIADFFEVSTDLLFGIQKDKREEEIQSCLTEYKKLCASGEVQKRLDLMTEARKRFPGEFRILICFAEVLAASPYSAPEGRLIVSQEELDTCKQDVIAVCQNIIEDCTIDEIRYRAIDLLSMTYSEIGDMKNAVMAAEMLPDYFYTRNNALYRLYDYDTDEHIRFYQENIQHLTLDLWLWIRSAVWGQVQAETKIKLCRKAIILYQLMYENGDYGYHHTVLAQIYQHIAAAYISIEDYDHALDSVEKYVFHQTAFIQTPSRFSHTSILFDHLTFFKEELTRNHTCSDSEIALNALENKIYDPIRNTERFKTLIEELRKY